nr:RNA-directed DNA polymerase, eukaryota, nucleotide-binding alpha-beta plait domain protein [Tanacetum cinerariifolium]
DLWKVCNGYGTVVDVFIPSKRSKAGKRFVFVRFIKVLDLDHLIENLNTIWIGRLHLFANPVRYERPKGASLHKGVSSSSNSALLGKQPKVQDRGGSYVNVVKGNNLPPVISTSPALVLDESCIVSRNLDFFVLGETKNPSSITNLYVLLLNEGFHNVKLSYLGGLWVMIEMESLSCKEKLLKHEGVASWFNNLGNAQEDFVSKERIVWVDIKGVPIHAWTFGTFKKIGSKWGEVMEIEEYNDGLFARKKAKELFMWSPVFKVDNEAKLYSEEVSSIDFGTANGDNINNANSDLDSDNDAVSDTFYRENMDNLDKDNSYNHPQSVNVPSPDLFNIHELLRKNAAGVPKTKSPSPSHKQSQEFCSHVMVEQSQDAEVSRSDFNRVGNNEHMSSKGGSILEVLDVMIKVGKAMGYDIGGCMKDIESIISSQGAHNDLMNCLSINIQGLGSKAKKDWAKELIGNGAIGNFGGIFCMWDPNVFLKENHAISDNFVAVTRTWIPTCSKLLIISVYAPQSRVDKRVLWNFIYSLVTRWHGESLVLGDFNEVRSTNERRGSIFNIYGAADFNEFISNSSLIEIQLEGYSFTWSHPSACKMSKLDRFLVTEGFLSAFPLCSAICLERHLSDHRPILLRESHLDLGTVNKDIILSPMNLMKQLHDIKLVEACDFVKKAKVKWEIEGDENSKFFHGIVNQKRANLAIKGIMVDGDWVDTPSRVKDEFVSHFASRFQSPCLNRSRINFTFPNRLNSNQVASLEMPIDSDEIRSAVWACGENKLSSALDGLISEVQSAFLPNRQILDGPFIINEILSWCKQKRHQAMIIKVDFAKAYNSVRWDFLEEVLIAFGFVLKWCSWILDSLKFGKASVLINVHKSHLLGVGVPDSIIVDAATSLGCSIMKTPFTYLGVSVGSNMTNIKAWDDIIRKIKSRLSKWKVKTLSVGGIFFTGACDNEEKISWVKWSKVLSPKKHGGLGVSSFYALNRALLFKWVWRFISQANSFWAHVISSIHGSNFQDHALSHASPWTSIIREVQVLKNRDVDLVAFCQKRVGNGLQTSF